MDRPTPTGADLSLALEFALDAARAGGDIALRHYRRDLAVERKKDGTFVTEADRAVEGEIRARIAEAWPEHNVLGEEEGFRAAGGGAPLRGAPTWIVDPIDETNNFIAGIPIWATLVGLRVGNESVAGACHAPALGETYDGARALGARVNGDAIEVDPVGDLSEATFLYASAGSFDEAGLGGFFDALVAGARRTRGFGGFWGHMLVARGAAHVMVEPDLSPWDVCALEPIVGEAGGRLTHLHGEKWSGRGSCLTTNGALHDEIVALARSRAPEWLEEQMRRAAT